MLVWTELFHKYFVRFVINTNSVRVINPFIVHPSLKTSLVVDTKLSRDLPRPTLRRSLFK